MLKNLFKQSAIYGLGDILTRFFTILLIPLYTKLLSVESNGIIAILSTSYFILFSFYQMGIGLYIVRIYKEIEKKDIFNQSISTLIQTNVGGTALLSLLLSGIIFLIPGKMIFNIPKEYFCYVIWAAFFNVLVMFPLALYRAEERPLSYISFSISFFALNVVLIIILIRFFNMDVMGKLLGDLVSMAIFCGISFFVLRRYLVKKFDKALALDAIRYGLPLAGSFLAWWLIFKMELYALLLFRNLREVGIYNITFQIAFFVLVLTQSMEKATAPFFYNNLDNPRMLSKFDIFMQFSFSFLGGLVILGILFGKQVVILLSTPEYMEGVKYLPLLLLSCYSGF